MVFFQFMDFFLQHFFLIFENVLFSLKLLKYTLLSLA